MHNTVTILKDRLALVEQRLTAACQRARRARAEVQLVAVTKTVGTEIASLLPALGVLHLGENRPQELWRKAAVVPGAHWHLIGHLQRNKVARTLPLVHLVHAVDSVRLLEAIEAEAQAQGRSVDVLLEVNTSGEASKQGFGPAQIGALGKSLEDLSHLRVCGLMTMAALQDPEACRPSFALLRQLRERLRQDLMGRHPVEHLSMGMSNDFEIAVEEGATLVRLGTVLFEGLS